MRSKADTRHRAKTKKDERSAHCIEKNINFKIFHHTFPSPARLVERRGGRSRGRERVHIMLPHAKPPTVQGRVRAKRTAEGSRPCQNGGNSISENHCRPNSRTTEISRPEIINSIFFLYPWEERLPSEGGRRINFRLVAERAQEARREIVREYMQFKCTGSLLRQKK